MSLENKPKFVYGEWEAREHERSERARFKQIDDLVKELQDEESDEPQLATSEGVEQQARIRNVDSVQSAERQPVIEDVSEFVPVYSFSPVDTDASSLNDEQLFRELTGLVEHFKSPSDYSAMRQRYCSLSIALNERALLAPAFRPYPAIPKNGERNESHLLMQRDRVVIDTHWLFSRGERLTASDGDRNWKGLLDLKKPFNWKRVESFAAANINNNYRAGSIFNMTPLQQSQTLSFRTISFYARWDRISRGSGSGSTRQRGVLQLVASALNQWSEVNVRLKKETYRAYAMAVLLLGPEGLQRQVAALAGLILGEAPLKESRARKIINTLVTKVPELASLNRPHSSSHT